MSIALQSVPGSVTGTELESEDGVTLREIEVLDGTNRTAELEIDAHTGDVLATETDDGHDEDDDDRGDDRGEAEQMDQPETQDRNGN